VLFKTGFISFPKLHPPRRLRSGWHEETKSCHRRESLRAVTRRQDRKPTQVQAGGDTQPSGLRRLQIDDFMQFPELVFVVSFLLLCFSIRIGTSLRGTRWKLAEDGREDFDVVQSASLTLLGLIIGFTFSMAVGRYDQRSNNEAAEANAIGTAYVRADLLPAADGAKVRGLLKSYLDQRISFYQTRDANQLLKIDQATTELQNDLWAAAAAPAQENPTPVVAMAVSGVNDVLDSQGYTLASWRNRIPVAAWILMAAIAVCCSILVGYGARRAHIKTLQFFVLPLLVSIAFFLIADIDSPNGGVILVRPRNLAALTPMFK
jgi:hypothetical protein